MRNFLIMGNLTVAATAAAGMTLLITGISRASFATDVTAAATIAIATALIPAIGMNAVSKVISLTQEGKAKAPE